jgi:hypothetical protein
MADEPVRGWLPPAAPGGRPPPRFDTVPEEPPAPPAAAPPPVTPAAPAPRPAPGFVRPQRGVRNPAAAWGLGLGIAGLGLLLLSLGSFFIVTLPLSGAAWWLGARERRRVRAGDAASGESQATAALWLGRVGVIAGLLAMVAFFVLVAAGVDFEQLRDNLQRELDRQREQSDSEGVRSALERVRATVGGRFGR